MNNPVNIFWFRRDLRLDDNTGLYHALKAGKPVQPLFIFDTDILDTLDDRSDARVSFIHLQLEKINEALKKVGSTILIRIGKPVEVWKKLVMEFQLENVFTNHDYEPYAVTRDLLVNELLKKNKIGFFSYKDQVIFEKNEIVKKDGTPYTVFTPYMKKWKSELVVSKIKPLSLEKYYSGFNKIAFRHIPDLKSLGFIENKIPFPSSVLNTNTLTNYEKLRDIPSANATSKLSIHLRFGTISIRHLTEQAGKLSEKFLNELIWREFYMMILWHFPFVKDHAFKKKYDELKWRNNEKEFQHWCDGKTGYPIVDAGMRELNSTGFMHNRVRMITAMFLTKYLLVDWRWGEAYFAEKLLDYELASNNGGWQWCAGTGVDAAPYFRIFSMDEQAKRFDPQQLYIKKWVPEYGSHDYPKPIVNYVLARKRCLEFYKNQVKY